MTQKTCESFNMFNKFWSFVNFKFQKKSSVMRIIVTLLPLVFGDQGPCRVGAQDRQICQKICDATSYCEAWSFNDSIKTCWMKQRYGWTTTTDNDFVSGFKGVVTRLPQLLLNLINDYETYRDV